MQNLPPKAGSFSDQALKNKAFAPIIVALGSAQDNMSEATSSTGSVIGIEEIILLKKKNGIASKRL